MSAAALLVLSHPARDEELVLHRVVVAIGVIGMPSSSIGLLNSARLVRAHSSTSLFRLLGHG